MLLEWEASGDIPEDLQVVGVSTAVSADRPELPARPVAGRQGLGRGRCSPTTCEQTAAQAYGVTGYPFLTFIDADGNVVARTSGELPVEELQALVDATVATS